MSRCHTQELRLEKSQNAEITTAKRQNRKTDKLRLIALSIVTEGRIQSLSTDHYLVASNIDSRLFTVTWAHNRWLCDCQSGKGRFCEHIYAVSYMKNLDGFSLRNKDEIRCPKCDSPPSLHVRKGQRTNRYGIAQTYSCKMCGLRFVHRPGFQKMRSNPTAIVASLDLYFKGLSLSKICSHLKEFYGINVTKVTVYNWIRKYISLIKRYTDRFKPIVSGKWHADETQVKINARQAYLWNLMDSETRFLIAKLLSFNRRSEEAQELFEKALSRVGKEPRTLVTDGLKSYNAAIDAERKQGYLITTDHISGTLGEAKNNMIERMHGTMRERTKTIRGLDNLSSGQLFADGLEIYYNYLRLHSMLNGKTPSEEAGIEIKGENRWLTIIQNASKFTQERSKHE